MYVCLCVFLFLYGGSAWTESYLKVGVLFVLFSVQKDLAQSTACGWESINIHWMKEGSLTLSVTAPSLLGLCSLFRARGIYRWALAFLRKQKTIVRPLRRDETGTNAGPWRILVVWQGLKWKNDILETVTSESVFVSWASYIGRWCWFGVLTRLAQRILSIGFNPIRRNSLSCFPELMIVVPSHSLPKDVFVYFEYLPVRTRQNSLISVT